MGTSKEVLIRVADEHLYEMKHSQGDVTAPSRAASAKRPEAPAAMFLTSTASSPPAAPGETLRSKNGAEQRKWERVSMAGTSAYAQMIDSPQTARLLDFSYGGVALEVYPQEELAPTFAAVLHVPILEPVRVHLRRLYQVRTASGQKRVGCAFLSGAEGIRAGVTSCNSDSSSAAADSE
jgi:hypothetical protein